MAEIWFLRGKHGIFSRKVYEPDGLQELQWCHAGKSNFLDFFPFFKNKVERLFNPICTAKGEVYPLHSYFNIAPTVKKFLL